MRTSPAGHAAAEVALLALRDQIVAAVAADTRTHAEIAYAAGLTEAELDGLLAQDRLDLGQCMTIAQGLTDVGTVAFTTTFAPNGPTPTVAGTAQEGQTLTATPGTYTGSPAPTITYQWERLSSAGVYEADISGATSATYVVAGALVGKKIRVKVTGTNTEGAEINRSAATATVIAA